MQKLTSPFDLIKKAVAIFAKKENFIYLIQIYLPMAFFSIISIAQNYLPENIKNSSSVWMISGVVLLQLIYLLISVFVALSGIIAVGKIIGDGELSVRRTYESALPKYWIFLLLSSALTLIYLFGFVLLIIPGVIFVVWFAFSRFAAVEKGLGVKDALLKSKDLVKGIYWKILGRLLSDKNRQGEDSSSCKSCCTPWNKNGKTCSRSKLPLCVRSCSP